MRSSMIPTKTIAMEFPFRDCIECHSWTSAKVQEQPLYPNSMLLLYWLRRGTSSNSLSHFVPHVIALDNSPYLLVVGDQVKVKMAWDNISSMVGTRSEVVAAISSLSSTISSIHQESLNPSLRLYSTMESQRFPISLPTNFFNFRLALRKCRPPRGVLPRAVDVIFNSIEGRHSPHPIPPTRLASVEVIPRH